MITAHSSSLSPALTCRLRCTSLFLWMMSTHGFMPAAPSSVFGKPCCYSFIAHTSCAKNSPLSIPSFPSLTVNSYNTTPDSQLPYKTDITAKVPSCQFTLYNTYRSIFHKSTVLCPNSHHLLTRLQQLAAARTSNMLFALYPANRNYIMSSTVGLKV